MAREGDGPLLTRVCWKARTPPSPAATSPEHGSALCSLDCSATVTMMEISRVKSKLRGALQELEEKDHFLLAWDAHERSIVHRLACYLEGRFEGYSVDVEYNRQGAGGDPKRVKRPRRRRFPDIVVHERGPGENNLLAIECKKSSNRTSRAADKKTLEDLKADHGYKYAVFIEIQVGKDPAPRDRFSREWI